MRYTINIFSFLLVLGSPFVFPIMYSIMTLLPYRRKCAIYKQFCFSALNDTPSLNYKHVRFLVFVVPAVYIKKKLMRKEKGERERKWTLFHSWLTRIQQRVSYNGYKVWSASFLVDLIAQDKMASKFEAEMLWRTYRVLIASHGADINPWWR